MLLLSAKHSRPLVWWEDTIWKAVRNDIWRTSYSVWSNGRISPYFCERPIRDYINLVLKSCQVYSSVMKSMRGGIWKGDILVADIEELEQMDASELHQDLRTSTLIRDSPDRGEKQDSLRGESEGSSSTSRQGSSWYDGQAKGDFGLSQEIHSPSSRGTSQTVFWCRKNEDYWNADGDRELSDTWTGFTRFTVSSEKPPEGFLWSGERLTRKLTTSRPDKLWTDMWMHMSDASKRNAKQKWAIEKPKLDNVRKLRGIFFTERLDEDFKNIMKKPATMPCKAPIKSGGKPIAVLGKSRQNTLVLSTPTDAREFDWKELLTGIMRIILQRKE